MEIQRDLSCLTSPVCSLLKFLLVQMGDQPEPVHSRPAKLPPGVHKPSPTFSGFDLARFYFNCLLLCPALDHVLHQLCGLSIIAQFLTMQSRQRNHTPTSALFHL